ncbi:GNAT family N-acetyltransferase [Streptomyces clavuligerus]|nr:GNAT family N-acetyltransferase [Streptomyces clavuligerus]ANW21602.1 acetyltransferase [Streptomyces clavuligerus]AXU16228.1 GNAT family N-acetyltransferase [Streptomyces clavuligerus]EDY53366.1 acetyltransferase [Streptomyces clavuligerus]MBY6306386.1 GNAT family N-acetyltransferase [Streptomyces clavuligerus]QCS09008.1 GNAT family N-acetyltransferase [Streptomyces clavuligerus]
MDALRVVRATAADSDRLTAMVRGARAYEGEYAAMVAGYLVEPAYIEAHPVFLAVDGRGTLLGFYSLLLGGAELDLMFVADGAQGLGIGRRLIVHMLGEARAAGLTSVRVVSHPPSEGFYRSVGAERVGVSPAQPPKVTWERPELVFPVPAPG